MAGPNRLMQMAQSTGGSPYDEDAYMRIPVPRSGGNALMGGGSRPSDEDLKAMAGAGYKGNEYTTLNEILNERLINKYNPTTSNYVTGGFKNHIDGDYGYYPQNSRHKDVGGIQERLDIIKDYRRTNPEPSTDMEMMMTYGPPEQVVIDQQGRPIPLNDPRHPRNQQNMGVLQSYPQQRR